MNPIRALHSKDIERACNLDRAWFTAHPGCSCRLRAPLTMEFNGPLAEAPDGLSWRVLVIGFAGAPMRLRCPVALPVFRPNESFLEDELADLFDQIAPAEFRALPAFIKRKMEEGDAA